MHGLHALALALHSHFVDRQVAELNVVGLSAEGFLAEATELETALAIPIGIVEMFKFVDVILAPSTDGATSRCEILLDQAKNGIKESSDGILASPSLLISMADQWRHHPKIRASYSGLTANDLTNDAAVAVGENERAFAADLCAAIFNVGDIKDFTAAFDYDKDGTFDATDIFHAAIQGVNGDLATKQSSIVASADRTIPSVLHRLDEAWTSKLGSSLQHLLSSYVEWDISSESNIKSAEEKAQSRKMIARRIAALNDKPLCAAYTFLRRIVAINTAPLGPWHSSDIVWDHHGIIHRPIGARYITSVLVIDVSTYVIMGGVTFAEGVALFDLDRDGFLGKTELDRLSEAVGGIASRDKKVSLDEAVAIFEPVLGNELARAADLVRLLTMVEDYGWERRTVVNTAATTWCEYRSRGTLIVPDGVTKIPDNAFKGCDEIIAVELPPTLVEIGESAFVGCSSLVSINLHETGVTSIGAYAFSGCTSLETVALPESASTIADGLFNQCSALTSVTISASTTMIGDRSFSGCSSLSLITLPASVDSIGAEAFHGCEALTELTFPPLPLTVGKSAFMKTPKLQWTEASFNGHDCGSFDGALVDASACAMPKCQEEITIPFGVTTIPKDAFISCNQMISVKLPSTLVEIGESAFVGCSSLVSINLHETGVTSIGAYAFSGCTSLETVALPESASTIADGLFNQCSALTSVTISASTTMIGDRSFSGCSSLSLITLPASVDSIGAEAFHGCEALTELTFPPLPLTVGKSAFMKTPKLQWTEASFNGHDCGSFDGALVDASACAMPKCQEEITIPFGVTTIPKDAFISCNQMISVKLPSTLVGIGESAFHKCSSLVSINLPAGLTTVHSDAFEGCDALEVNVLQIMANRNDPLIPLCDDTTTEITLPEDLTSLPAGAFSGCIALTSVTLPDTFVTFGAYAFRGCTSLKTINLPDSVVLDENDNLNKKIFLGCTSLKWGGIKWNSNTCDHYDLCPAVPECPAGEDQTVVVPEGVLKIPRNAFYDCESMTSIQFPSNTLKEIASGAFRSSRLKSISIPPTVTKIGSQAFYNSKSLSSVELPADVTIAHDAFLECTPAVDRMLARREEPRLPMCDATTTVVVPAGVETIPKNAFFGCSSIITVELPESVTAIGAHAFSDCSSLSTINLPKTQLSQVGENVFTGTKVVWGAWAHGSTCKQFSMCPTLQKCTATTTALVSSQWRAISYVFPPPLLYIHFSLTSLLY